MIKLNYSNMNEAMTRKQMIDQIFKLHGDPKHAEVIEKIMMKYGANPEGEYIDSDMSDSQVKKAYDEIMKSLDAVSSDDLYDIADYFKTDFQSQFKKFMKTKDAKDPKVFKKLNQLVNDISNLIN